jgi:hypothetical protein
MTRHSWGAFTVENLPLFASDAEIGAALLGSKRASEWKVLAPLYERQGFPKIDPVMGDRYVPAIKAFFDKQYGVATLVSAAPAAILGRLAGSSAPPAVPPLPRTEAKPTARSDLLELFFAANTGERRLILTNLDVAAETAARRPAPKRPARFSSRSAGSTAPPLCMGRRRNPPSTTHSRPTAISQPCLAAISRCRKPKSKRVWRVRSASIPICGSSRSRIAPGGISSMAMWWLSGAYLPLVLTCEGCTTRPRSER